MRMKIAAFVWCLMASTVQAGPYYNLALHSSSTTMKLSGDIQVAISSVTSSTPTILLQGSSGNIGIGTANPLASIHISKNGDAAVVAIGYSNNPFAIRSFTGFSARGTDIAPTATQSGDGLAFFGGRGHDGTSFSGFPSGVGIFMTAAENWTLTNKGTNIALRTTPTGSTIPYNAWTVSSQGNVVSGGSVTASAFYGNGAGLTGVTTTPLTDTSTFTYIPPGTATQLTAMVCNATMTYVHSGNYNLEISHYGTAQNDTGVANAIAIFFLIDGGYLPACSPACSSTVVPFTQESGSANGARNANFTYIIPKASLSIGSHSICVGYGTNAGTTVTFPSTFAAGTFTTINNSMRAKAVVSN